RVLELVGALQVVEQTTDVMVGVREEAGVDLGHPRKQTPLVMVQRIPWPRVIELGEPLPVRAGARLGRPDRVDRWQLGVGRHEPDLLLAGQRLLTEPPIPNRPLNFSTPSLGA